MEHRWGTRHSIGLPVRLDARPRVLAFARLLNASSSGAYVETRAAPPLMACVHVELDWGSFHRDEPHRIPAYVVRTDSAGIGLEWCDFAPMAILELIEGQRLVRSEGWRRVAAQDGLYLPTYAIPVPAVRGSPSAHL